MSNSTPDTPQSTNELPKLDPVAALFALGSDVRWRMIKLLADGRVMSTSEVATAFERDLDGIGKQLRVLAAAGVVDGHAGEDRRQSVYSIPATRRPAPGIIDYGFCVIDLNKA